MSVVYATKAAITITLTSIADDSARESTVIDNTSNLYDDVLVRIRMNGQSGGTGLCEFYVYAALDDTEYSDGATGTDAAFTAANRRNSPHLVSIQMNAATGVEAAPVSVASVFGGVVPPKWGLICINRSGATLSATGGDTDIDYQGVTY